MEELGFLPNYIGTLLHDHNKVQYNFGTNHGECNSHISNNRAEADIRPAKRKLNIGIFRSEVGAKYYLQIRSFISTFLKNNRNVFQGIKDAFNGNAITLKLE